MSDSETPIAVDHAATGQQSATDSTKLAFQPGYWQPWEQSDPTERAYVDYTDDPIGHVEWVEARAEDHKTQQASPELT